MKKKPSLIGKLKLNKESVSFLSNEEMNFIKGGATEQGICGVTVDAGCPTAIDNCNTDQCQTSTCAPNTTSIAEGYSMHQDCYWLKTVWWCDPAMSCYCTVGACDPT